jgi:hypothetical protein
MSGRCGLAGNVSWPIVGRETLLGQVRQDRVVSRNAALIWSYFGADLGLAAIIVICLLGGF